MSLRLYLSLKTREGLLPRATRWSLRLPISHCSSNGIRAFVKISPSKSLSSQPVASSQARLRASFLQLSLVPKDFAPPVST